LSFSAASEAVPYKDLAGVATALGPIGCLDAGRAKGDRLKPVLLLNLTQTPLEETALAFVGDEGEGSRVALRGFAKQA
jgi:hypothetical protein